MAKLTRWPLRYGFAAMAVAAAVAATTIPMIGRGLITLLFLAVCLSAGYGGIGPGLFATLLITIFAAMGPISERDLAPWRVVAILTLAAGGVLITLVMEALHVARRRVEASQQWFTAVLTSIGDAVIATDGQGRVVFLNPVAQTLTGWVSDEAVGKPLCEIFPIVNQATREPVEDPVARVLREDIVVGLANHTVLIARDGTERPIDDSGAPIKETGRATAGVVLVFRDVSERQQSEAIRARLEQQLRQQLQDLAEADRRKDEFLAMLAHELRNPLAAINTAAQVTTLTGDRDQLGWCMAVVNRQVKHLARLIDDLLDVSRITRGKIELRTEWLDVSAVVRGAVELARPMIDARRHKLTVAIAPERLPAEGDPVRLEQIVTNLLLNAAKFTEPGGEIWVSADQEREGIVIKVRDTGMGIPPDQISRMFELFAQGDHSLARSEGGLGIGLTLARSLAEMHGGRLTATSAGPGTGTEFVVRLPAASPVSASSMGPKPQGEPAQMGRLRVLVIDDNIDMARGLATMLKMQNHEVWIASDGPSGLEAARLRRPEVVLLDIGLPGMDGYQVAERLRGAEFGQAVRLIAVTGYGQEEDRQRAFSAGFDQVVTKPVDYATLRILMVGPGSGRP
jgi:PAS domain S-box-containing protein